MNNHSDKMEREYNDRETLIIYLNIVITISRFKGI